jgi:hypothetical protein
MHNNFLIMAHSITLAAAPAPAGPAPEVEFFTL